jgi:hypothetical protein
MGCFEYGCGLKVIPQSSANAARGDGESLDSLLSRHVDFFFVDDFSVEFRAAEDTLVARFRMEHFGALTVTKRSVSDVERDLADIAALANTSLERLSAHNGCMGMVPALAEALDPPELFAVEFLPEFRNS